MVPVAVLFDFDGVLVDSMPAHVDAWSAATRCVFGHGLDVKERKAIVGKSTRVIASQIASWRAGPSEAARLTELKRGFLLEQVHRVEMLPGVATMLAFLLKHKIPFGIASNAPRDYVQETATALSMPVQVVLGCEDVTHPKPAPDLYLLCAKRLGVSPADHQRMVVFEDSTHGIQAAVRAGAMAIGITTHQPPKALRHAGAKHTFQDFRELLTSGLWD